jgi:hypothetical protein
MRPGGTQSGGMVPDRRYASSAALMAWSMPGNA